MHRRLSLIVNAYNAQAALDRQLAHWSDYAPALCEAIEFVIVDDGSPTPLTLDMAALPPTARVVLARIEQDIAWNMPGARNLGALLAHAPWLLFTDADHFLPQGSLQRLLAHEASLSAQTLYRFARIEGGQPINSHVNSFVCARDGFWCAGGYDEDFAGHYGHEDSFFLQTWTERVGSMLMLTNVWLEAQPRYSTSGLDRDTTRNSALFADKVARLAQAPAPAQCLRFPWSVRVLRAGTSSSA